MEDRTTKGTAKKMSAETFNELLRESAGEHKRKELSGLRYKQVYTHSQGPPHRPALVIMEKMGS